MSVRRDSYRGVLLAFLLGWLGIASDVRCEEFLGDRSVHIDWTHQQQWGDFGLQTAAAAPGAPGSPLRIGEKTFERGLGHHANGEIVIDLKGQFVEFRSLIGVQWQGGNRGSVVFRIAVDGAVVFESPPMSDSDPAQEVTVPLQHAHELRLIATDAGDGIGSDMANWVEARLVRDLHSPRFGKITTRLAGQPAPPASASTCGFSLIASDAGPQVAVMQLANTCTVSVRQGETVDFGIPVENLAVPMRVSLQAAILYGQQAEVSLAIDEKQVVQSIEVGDWVTLEIEVSSADQLSKIALATHGMDDEAGVRWRRLRCVTAESSFDVPLDFPQGEQQLPPRILPPLRPAIEQELVEWDWRMQDGIETERESRTWEQAIENVMQRGDNLLRDLVAAGSPLVGLTKSWEELRSELQRLSANPQANESQWEDLWRRVHRIRRDIAFANPLADIGPLLFVKRVPSAFSHQLTQYSGIHARPGGGVFVLDNPGTSMHSRQLATLPEGSYQHPEVSWDGKRVMFAFCETESATSDPSSTQEQHYHLFEVASDGSDLRQVTDGPYDDFSPRYLPNGKILFLSTRRGGFHRCGRGPCPVYTLAVAEADGSNPHVVSFHETQEWDPAVLNDGRVIYTRWDYVDRNAVHYQQLWSVRPDGSDVRAYYGNNTFNPVGIWEARPIPGSGRVMATAGAHHAMTAGSIILVDVTQGVDGPEPIMRLTPDALFPESEFPVQGWHAPTGVPTPPQIPPEEQRWPGHCYRTPYPLSESYFLAAYSFDPLIGEPHANPANMFGLYLVDRFGNKELIYRDANIGSLWPTPLRARPSPPALASTLQETYEGEGTFLVQNLHESWPKLPQQTKIERLRILQVLLKTTPHANTPKVGLANASPGKQVLGTVPVEPDGSAYFRAPAGVPLLFQALDEQGMAVQTMRSLTYLQPGEQATCIGCHQYPGRVPKPGFSAVAQSRAPSTIAAGPDGSKPMSYPILVQPVLDKHCIDCHSGVSAAGGVDLTDTPDGSFTASYNALAPLVSFSEWNGPPSANAEPQTRPDIFGARASKLMAMLLNGHEGVKLDADDIERLATWMDANALFYGTFDLDGQQRQQSGERIAEPSLK
jgi:hypothetical protein